MTLYAIEDKTCLTICEEAEIVNHTDWAALHICKTKTAALDIDVTELADDCEAVDLAALDRRTADELSIIRIPPTPLTAKQTAERCAHYLTYSLRRFPEVAAAALAAIADPANDGRWTDADSVRDIVWPIVTAINNPPTEQAAAPTQEAQEAPQDGDSTEDNAQDTPTDEAPQDAPQAVRDEAPQGAGTPRTTAA